MEMLVHSPGVIEVLKPPGVTSESAIEWIQRFLRESGRDDAARFASRLDAATSGALVLARGGRMSASANHLQAQFAGRLVAKT